MTEAINGSGQAPVVALMSAASAKIGEGERAQGKNASKGARANDDSLPDAARAPAESEQDSDALPVKHAQKSAHGAKKEGGKADDQDASFEATIDSIDRTDDSANQAAAAPQAAAWNAAVAIAQMSTGQSKSSPAGKSGDASTAPSNVPGTPPLQTLKQERISALLLARQRLLARDTSEIASDGAAGEEVVTVPVTVKSRETHWSFADTIASGDLHKAALSRADGAQSAAASAPNETAVLQGNGTVKASDSIKQAPPQMAPPDSAGDKADQQSSGDNRDAATASRDDRRSGSTKARDSGQTTVSKFTDRIATDDKVPANAISSAMQQVRTGLLGALTGDPLQASRANAALGLQSRLVNPGNVIRTIELTLSPADLGSVSLRLSLRSNVLTIEAEASKASTAKLLNDDRSVLERNLRDAGYELSSLKITDGGSSGQAAALTAMTAAAATPPSQAGAMPFQNNDQPRFGFAQYQGGDPQRRDGSAHDRSQQRSRSDNPQSSPATDTGGLRQVNAIYI